MHYCACSVYVYIAYIAYIAYIVYKLVQRLRFARTSASNAATKAHAKAKAKAATKANAHQDANQSSILQRSAKSCKLLHKSRHDPTNPCGASPNSVNIITIQNCTKSCNITFS